MIMIKKVSVFGNPLVDKDSLPLKILPKLKKKFPDIDFVIEDPTETLDPPRGEWWILDSVEGINDVTVLDDLSKLDFTNRVSVHDYDLSFDLKLLQKLGKLGRFNIIAIPITMNEDLVLNKLKTVLSEIKS